jgi:hypothetical protein
VRSVFNCATIHKHFVAAKHWSLIVLEVCDAMQPLIHLPTTKTRLLNVALLGCKWKAMINGMAAMMELT